MQMPEPTEHHQRLRRFVGSWRGREKMHPSPWDPNPSEADSELEARLDLDGLVLITNYRQLKDGATTFRGHGVYGYDPKLERYTMYWFDTGSYHPGGAVLGRWEGDVLTYERTNERGTSRYIYTLGDDDHYDFAIEMSEDGRSFQRWMDSTWTRA